MRRGKKPRDAVLTLPSDFRVRLYHLQVGFLDLVLLSLFCTAKEDQKTPDPRFGSSSSSSPQPINPIADSAEASICHPRCCRLSIAAASSSSFY
ncbi:unnamed protein product [Linum trigynum]|uniref:Uncharacterized protein n=1 Tax=Linum trigynum TaxID=586398 RepID=A0AAV2EWD8_9ROSI